MTLIPPTLKHVDSFRVIGPSTRTKNCDEFNIKTAKIPNLWQQFASANLTSQATIFGVYSDYESDANGLYTLTVGIASDDAQVQFNSIIIQTGNYLVFEAIGPMPSTVIATWKHIWDYFAKENEYQRNFISDFEAYNGSDEVAIYIGIK